MLATPGTAVDSDTTWHSSSPSHHCSSADDRLAAGAGVVVVVGAGCVEEVGVGVVVVVDCSGVVVGAELVVVDGSSDAFVAFVAFVALNEAPVASTVVEFVAFVALNEALVASTRVNIMAIASSTLQRPFIVSTLCFPDTINPSAFHSFSILLS